MNEQELISGHNTEMQKILNGRKRLTVNLPRNTAVYRENSGNRGGNKQR
jgi:ABC-type siderophore export system fused ATPase/permease subunit